jgi:hypothetical protein
MLAQINDEGMREQHEHGSSVRKRGIHGIQVSQKVGWRGHYKNNIIARFLIQQTFQ